MAFGLVLAGGGTIGVSWTIGALVAARDGLGFDLAAADVTVGTSAGAVVAPQFLSGRSPEELIAAQRATPEGRGEADGWATSFDPQMVAEVFPRWVETTEMNEETARWIGERALRASNKTSDEWISVIGGQVQGAWPEKDLRLVATDCVTGRKTVFTSSSGVEMVRAAAASSSVPSIIPPVAVGDSYFMDGGVWSISNADLLVDTGVERAFILDPQAGGGFLAPFASAMLQREVVELERVGIVVHTLIPSDEYGALGINAMDPMLRGPALEIGLRDGEAWARALAPTLQ